MNCAKGVCAPTAKKATLNASDVAEMLAKGDLTVMSGNLAQNIVISAPLSWASAQRLTLDSYHSIEFDKPVTIAGSGTLKITTNDGGSDGDFSFIGKGHVEFLDVSDSFHRLTINGQSYQLVRSPKRIARAFQRHPAYVALARSYNAIKDGTYSHPVVDLLEGVLEGLGNTISNWSISDLC